MPSSRTDDLLLEEFQMVQRNQVAVSAAEREEKLPPQGQAVADQVCKHNTSSLSGDTKRWRLPDATAAKLPRAAAPAAPGCLHMMMVEKLSTIIWQSCHCLLLSSCHLECRCKLSPQPPPKHSQRLMDLFHVQNKLCSSLPDVTLGSREISSAGLARCSSGKGASRMLPGCSGFRAWGSSSLWHQTSGWVGDL